MILVACLAFAAGLMSILIGVVIGYRDESSTPKWALVLGLVLLGVESVCTGLSCSRVLVKDVVFWQSLRFIPLSLLPGTWLLFALTYSRGAPRDYLREWRHVLGLSLVVPLVFALLAFRQMVSGVVAGDDHSAWFLQISPMGRAAHALFILISALALMNLERTIRAATGTMRWRIKFMIMGTGLLFCLRIYTSTVALLYSGFDISLLALDSVGLIVCLVLVVTSMTRARLLQVDVYPSHAVLCRSVTVMAVGVYLLIIGLLAKAVTLLGVAERFPLRPVILFLALVGLAILLFSDRVKQRTQRLVARHFGRPQYDYRKVWKAFAALSARAMEPGALCRSYAKLLSETFDVLGVNIWLIDEAGREFSLGGSTSLAEEQARDILGSKPDQESMIQRVESLPPVLDIDAGDSEAARSLRALTPMEFGTKGGHRICAPLKVGQELLGLVVLSDRVRGIPFTVEEMDLIGTIGEEISANLLRIRLSSALLNAKQMEAFQAMSAFMVHDLKNTASTLSLTLENLPRYFADPAFRQDALSSMSKSTQRINELIGRLTVLRQGLVIEPTRTDLNEIVREAVGALDRDRRSRVHVETAPLDPVTCDARQLQGVVTNLLLNALEAGGESGEVWVTTRRDGPRVRVSVRDNGAGMSREFISQNLFRPFKSTKRNGMGIGLFHSKTVVEAHGGHIEVQSTDGKGSTFSIVLGTGEER